MRLICFYLLPTFCEPLKTPWLFCLRYVELRKKLRSMVVQRVSVIGHHCSMQDTVLQNVHILNSQLVIYLIRNQTLKTLKLLSWRVPGNTFVHLVSPNMAGISWCLAWTSVESSTCITMRLTFFTASCQAYSLNKLIAESDTWAPLSVRSFFHGLWLLCGPCMESPISNRVFHDLSTTQKWQYCQLHFDHAI